MVTVTLCAWHAVFASTVARKLNSALIDLFISLKWKHVVYV